MFERKEILISAQLVRHPSFFSAATCYTLMIMQFILVTLTTIILQKSIKNVNNKNYSSVNKEGFDIPMVIIIIRYKKKVAFLSLEYYSLCVYVCI